MLPMMRREMIEKEVVVEKDQSTQKAQKEYPCSRSKIEFSIIGHHTCGIQTHELGTKVCPKLPPW